MMEMEVPAKTRQEQHNNRFMYEAVIFDMDGTLVATTEADYLAWKKLFAEYGQPLSYEAYFPLLGVRSADLVRIKLGLSGAEAEQAMGRKMQYFAEVAQQGLPAIPHAADLVRSFKAAGVKLALATSSRRPKMELVMRQQGLYELFEVIVTGEEVHKGKPDPEIFLLAAQKLGARPAACVVIEDAASGVQAAKAAGMKCVAITSTHEARALNAADAVVSSFDGLSPDALCRLLTP